MPDTVAPIASRPATTTAVATGLDERHLLVDIARRNVTFTLPRFLFFLECSCFSAHSSHVCLQDVNPWITFGDVAPAIRANHGGVHSSTMSSRRKLTRFALSARCKGFVSCVSVDC